VIDFGKYSKNILGISLKSSSKNSLKLKKILHTILFRFLLKFWEKMLFSKKFKFIYKSLYYLKVNVIMLNECFWVKPQSKEPPK